MTFTVAGEGFLTLKSDGVDSDVRVHKDLTITGETTFNGSIVGLVQGDVVQEMHLQAGTTYTLADTDHGKLVAINNASPITLTVPSGLRADFECAILQQGAGQITFSASGTTINNRQSFTKTAGLHALAGIRHYWPTNTLVTTGDME
jgi:hypothetical protein